MGELVELGSERNMVFDYLAGVRRVSACSVHERLAGEKSSNAFGIRLYVCIVYVPGGEFLIARNACVLIAYGYHNGWA